MAEKPGAEKHSFRELWTAHSMRTRVWTLAGVLLIVLVGWGIWRVHVRGVFSVLWERLQGLPLSSPSELVFLSLAVVALLGVAVLWKVPQWQVARVEGLDSRERFDCRNEARKTLAIMLGGVTFFTSAYFTWRNLNLTSENQFTERFAKAVEQLGASDAMGRPRLASRLSAIYAFEGLARDSKTYH